MRNYKELVVWQEAIELVKAVYAITRKLPPEERYALADQMRRAVVSIPSNIAEGHDRHSNNEFRHFLTIAKGSAAELDTQLVICKELQYISEEELAAVVALCSRLRARLYRFMAALEAK